MALLLLVITLIIAAFAMEDKITQLAVRNIGESIDAPMGMQDVSFTLIRDFPLATIEFKGLWMGASATWKDTSSSFSIDTLARFDELFIAVESKPLLDNIFNLRQIEMEGGYFNYLVKESGETCLDFLLQADSVSATQDTTSTVPKLNLDKLQLSNVICRYQDQQHKVYGQAKISALETSASFSEEVLNIEVQGSIAITESHIEETELYRMENADLTFNLAYSSDTLTINDLLIQTKGAQVNAIGKVMLGNELATDLSVDAQNLDLQELEKYIPPTLRKKYPYSKLAGNLQLQAKIEGKISEGELPHCEASYELENGQVQWENYPVAKQIRLSGSASNGALNNNASTTITLDRLTLQAGESTIDLNGSVHNLDQLHYRMSSTIGLNLSDAEPFIPDTLIQQVSGNLNIQLKTNGVLPDSINNEVVDYFMQNSELTLEMEHIDIVKDSSLSVQNLSAQIAYRDAVLTLDSVNLTIPQHKITLKDNAVTLAINGSLMQRDTTAIELDLRKIEMDGVALNGKLLLSDLNQPSYQLQNRLHVDLEKVKRFIPDTLITNLSGKANATISSSGSFDMDSIASQISNLIYDSSSFDVQLSNVSVETPDTLMKIEHLSGHLVLDSARIAANNLQFNYEEIQFNSDTTVIHNLYSTILKNQQGLLEVQGVWRLNDLNYDQLMAYVDAFTQPSKVADSKTSKDKSSNSSGWDQHYEVKGKLFINSMEYEDATISDINTLLNIKENRYVLDQLHCNAFHGKIHTSIEVLLQEGGKLEFHTKTQLEDLDIRQMLKEMNNFNQNEITYENISGVLNTENLEGQFYFIGDSILYPDIRLSCDFALADGAFYNYAPLVLMEDNLPGNNTLDTLVFKTIDTEVFVLQNAIYMPATNLSSNVLDLSALGMQTFGEDYKYHVRVRLRDLLKSADKRQRKFEEKGDKTKDDERNTSALVSYSLDGKDKNGLDNKNDRIKTENRIRTKDRLLRVVFHPNFFSFETNVSEEFRKAQ